MNTNQHALAAEIRAEAAAQRITARDLQRAVRVSSSSWSNYFNTCTRDVPMGVILDVAHELGMTGSELLRRAEARAAAQAGDIQAAADSVVDEQPPEARDLMRQAREDLRPKFNAPDQRKSNGS